MKHRLINDNIFDKIDYFTCIVERLMHISHILADSITDSEFEQFELASLALIINERLSNLHSELIEFLEKVEPYN